MKIYLHICLACCFFNCVSGEELAVKSPAYGLGKHRLFDANEDGAQLISSLSKGGFEYRVELNNNDFGGIKIYRITESTAQHENIALFNYRLHLSGDNYSNQWIVDAVSSDTEIAFLMASEYGYQYFKVSNQEVVAPLGKFLCERDGVNTTNWKVIQIQSGAEIFGEAKGIPEWRHGNYIQTIKLANINSIEVISNNGATSIFTIDNDKLKKNGNIVDGVDFDNPMLETEGDLTELFNESTTETLEDLRKAVSYYKGGKDFILNLLNQFSDQNAANQIRARINEAFAEN